MVAPDALSHRGREGHLLLTARLRVDIRCAVGIDGGVQVGSALQAVVGDGVVLVEGALCVEDLIAQLAGELHREVEVLIAEGVAPAEDELRRAVAQALAVLLYVQVGVELLHGPAAVAVAGLHEGEAVLVVAHELQAPEIAQRAAHLHAVRGGRDRIPAASRGPQLLEVVGLIEVVAQLEQLVGVVRTREGGGPLEVLRLHRDGLDHQLDTGVAHVAHVHQRLAVEVWRHRHVVPEEQVVGGLDIEVERTVDAVIQETVVETEVPLLGHLPLQVGVGVLHHLKGLDPLAVHRHHVAITRKVIHVLCQIRVTGGDTRHTVAHAEAQVAEPVAGVLHECLVHDVPAEGERGEGGPLVVGTELRAALMTDADECVVAVGIAVADTSEEAHELVVIPVAAHRGVMVLVCQERAVAQVVPEEGRGREVGVRGIEAVVLLIEIAVAHDGVEAVVVPLGIVARGQFEVLSDAVV